MLISGVTVCGRIFSPAAEFFWLNWPRSPGRAWQQCTTLTQYCCDRQLGGTVYAGLIETQWQISVVSECCWELRCCPRQPPPVTEPWLYTDCWRGFKPLVPSDKRFNHSKVWCTFISSSTSTVYAVQVCECYNINSYWYFYFLKYNTLGLQYCITTTLLYFTTVLHLLHLLHLSISSDRCNRCNPIVLQYCCCCEGGD